MAIVGTVSGAQRRTYLNDHMPPHVHVVYQGYRAKVEIATGSVRAGALPARILRDVHDWIAQRRMLRDTEWQRAKSGWKPRYLP
jgi:hypothetical protein